MAGDRLSKKTSQATREGDVKHEHVAAKLRAFGADVIAKMQLLLDGPVDPVAEREQRMREHGYTRVTVIDPDSSPGTRNPHYWTKGVEEERTPDTK